MQPCTACAKSALKSGATDICKGPPNKACKRCAKNRTGCSLSGRQRREGKSLFISTPGCDTDHAFMTRPRETGRVHIDCGQAASSRWAAKDEAAVRNYHLGFG